VTLVKKLPVEGQLLDTAGMLYCEVGLPTYAYLIQSNTTIDWTRKRSIHFFFGQGISKNVNLIPMLRNGKITFDEMMEPCPCVCVGVNVVIIAAC
jgi:hypothetical protein